MSRGKLIVFSGPPCSGKSTLAKRLSDETQIAYLQMDRICDRLIPNSAHGPKHREISYRAMHLAAELMLSHGHSVILDATYRHDRHRQSLKEIARRAGAELYRIQCVVSKAAALERFASRVKHPAIDLTPQRVARQLAAYPYTDDALKIDTTQDVRDSLAQIKSYTCL